MRVNPYGEDPLRLAVRLVNAPISDPVELEAVCRSAGVAIERAVTDADVFGTQRMLDEWLRVVDEPKDEERAAILNRLLADSTTVPSLTDHDKDGWHLHYREDDLELWKILRTMVYVGTALHFVTKGIHRLGRCREEHCARVFADFSRPGTQRYCSTSCANRDAVRRHRSRHL